MSTGKKDKLSGQQVSTKRPVFCPLCARPIWRKGWNAQTGERFYSHTFPKDRDLCCEQIGIIGLVRYDWPKPTSPPEIRPKGEI